MNIETMTPEQILDAAILQPRPLLVDANVVAYFGDLLVGLRKTVTCAGDTAKAKTCSAAPAKSVRKAPGGTASAPGRS